jgi:hypothetical protein
MIFLQHIRIGVRIGLSSARNREPRTAAAAAAAAVIVEIIAE